MGADHVINHRNDLSGELQKIGVKGVDYIFNCADTEEYIHKFENIINPLGKICLIVPTSKPVDIGPLMAKRASIVWEFMFSRPIFGVDLEKQGEILNRVADLVDSKVFLPTNTHTLPLSKIQEAHKIIESGSSIGKIVLPVQFD